MKKKRYTEEQIIGILKEADAGMAVTELCRKHGMSNPTFYKWRAKYGVLPPLSVGEMTLRLYCALSYS